MEMPRAVLHSLSVKHEPPDRARVRGTLRFGDLAPGMEFWFKDEAGRPHPVQILERTDRKQGIEVVVQGEELELLLTGRFLYALPHDGPT